jgi:carboxyl-terminal processing protease
MIRPFRLFATLAATLSLALGVTARVRAEPEPGPAIAYKGAAPARTLAGEDGVYKLETLPMLSHIIGEVKDNYVDPARLDPKAMVVAALESVEKAVAEVMVEADASGSKLTVTAGAAKRDFDIRDVDSIWKIRVVLGDVMAFVKTNLVAHEDLKEIEYAAVNGLLSTLDPHSVLLEPKYFKEMKLQTRGEFGGLGFVISMRDGNLSVVKVIKNTPAARAGIRAKDVITRIEEHSTVNMDLQDAVDRLRGKPQTKVAITVQRPVWPEPKRLALTREVINVETVAHSQLLPGSVGYVRLSQFSANTTRDLTAAIAQQRAEAGGKLAGLVLDLRGNPGGLLEQAVEVSDLFLGEGVIVKTVGEGRRMHQVTEASSEPGDLTSLPLVVLVNNSSASASEIVAGALKNNDRALVLGRQTFGKGSVQVLYDFNEPGPEGAEAALKLTIAQYLTPGDISIQETGITPDVLLLPGRALKESVNVFAPPRMMGEADLDRHFTNGEKQRDALEGTAEAAKPKRVEKAPLELRYLLSESEDALAKKLKQDAERPPHADGLELTPEQQEDEESEANPDEFVEDFQIRFARELLGRGAFATRPKLLDAAKVFVTERKAEEAKRLEKKFAELGVDWSSGPAMGTPRAVVTVSPPAGRDLKAGETLQWTVTVENRGDGAFRRLRAWTTSEKNPLLDRREFVFGTVRPGEKRSWTVPVKLPMGLDTRRDDVTFHFEEEHGRTPPELTTAVDVVEVAKPAFAFSLHVDDTKTGNGDGLPQRGETFVVRVDVRNAGAGVSGEKTFVSLKNLGDEKLFITKGRDSLGTIRPGEVKTANLEMELKRGSKNETLPVRVMIVDEKMDEYISEKLDLPIAKDAPAATPATGVVRVQAQEATLRTGASASSPPIATAKKGAVLPVDAKVGSFYRVQWAKGRYAFASDAEVTAAPRGVRTGAIAAVWQREPPRITLVPDPAKGPPVVDRDTFRLQGSAMVPTSGDPTARLRDVYVFVGEQKVFFKVVPESEAAPKLDFTADLPLEPGLNMVTVFARESDEFQTRRSMVVYRTPPAKVAQDGSRVREPGRAAQ